MTTATLAKGAGVKPGAAQAAPGAKRLRASNLDALEPFQGAHLESGQVNLLSLDAIVEAFGDRWQSRREGVYEHIERVIERNLGPNGYMTRVSETDYMVAQPDLGPFGAQAACLRALKETLSHFLGAVRPAAMAVSRITAIEAGELTAVQIDPRAALAGEAAEVEAAKKAEASDPTLLNPDRWTPFTASNGRQVRVSCNLEPVFELKGNTRIGYRMVRRVLDVETEEEIPIDNLVNLSRADLLRIDMATIARGVTRLKADIQSDQELCLIVPVSFVSLSMQESRKHLTEAFEQARQWVRRGVICEIHGLEDVPQGPLLSAIGFIRPVSILVVGHLTGDNPRVSSSMKDAGLQALSVNCPKHISGDAEFLGWARDSIKTARRITRSVMICGCDTQRKLVLAGMMEATHATMAAARKPAT